MAFLYASFAVYSSKCANVLFVVMDDLYKLITKKWIGCGLTCRNAWYGFALHRSLVLPHGDMYGWFGYTKASVVVVFLLNKLSCAISIKCHAQRPVPIITIKTQLEFYGLSISVQLCPSVYKEH